MDEAQTVLSRSRLCEAAKICYCLRQTKPNQPEFQSAAFLLLIHAIFATTSKLYTNLGYYDSVPDQDWTHTVGSMAKDTIQAMRSLEKTTQQVTPRYRRPNLMQILRT